MDKYEIKGEPIFFQGVKDFSAYYITTNSLHLVNTDRSEEANIQVPLNAIRHFGERTIKSKTLHLIKTNPTSLTKEYMRQDQSEDIPIFLIKTNISSISFGYYGIFHLLEEEFPIIFVKDSRIHPQLGQSNNYSKRGTTGTLSTNFGIHLDIMCSMHYKGVFNQEVYDRLNSERLERIEKDNRQRDQKISLNDLIKELLRELRPHDEVQLVTAITVIREEKLVPDLTNEDISLYLKEIVNNLPDFEYVRLKKSFRRKDTNLDNMLANLDKLFEEWEKNPKN